MTTQYFTFAAIVLVLIVISSVSIQIQAYGLTKQEIEWLLNQRNELENQSRIELNNSTTGIEDFNIYNYKREELEEAYLSIMSPLEKETWIKMKYFEMLGEDYLKESDSALRELERSAQELENFKFN